MTKTQVYRHLVEEVFHNGRAHVLAEHVTKDFVGHDPASPRDDVKQTISSLGRLLAQVEGVRYEVVESFEQGDRLATRFHIRANDRATGKPLEIAGISINRFEGELMAESWVVWDTLAIWRALGAEGFARYVTL